MSILGFLAVAWSLFTVITVAVAPVLGPRLADAIIRQALKDTSKYHIPGYMDRFWLLKYREWKWLKRWPRLGYLFRCAARVHHILRSDLDRHLHDHPWWTISLILKGSYIEWMPRKQAFVLRDAGIEAERDLVAVLRKPGDIVFRRATDRHQLKVASGDTVWTLFVMGPWVQDWGFYVPRMGKLIWTFYLKDRPNELV